MYVSIIRKINDKYIFVSNFITFYTVNAFFKMSYKK